MATGQKPVLPVNIPIPTKIGSKMGGAPTTKWDSVGFDNHSHIEKSELTMRFRPRIQRRALDFGAESNMFKEAKRANSKRGGF